ncbi:uncharacterized protein LOC121603440 isoform X2 [Anopheles merus]|uniref:uncharacterized protein LOC121601005 isoform X2 n=1 Tax=Anopheles merus TaxID=30066 RepID=UPI001BE4B594|nr:uncharacterized protein LOC121601005 isoform X2 [Anopheles merus]XP_041788197.1 uncharacterized protein LOC121603440 isoform X2 [Anopheles merus]
MDETQIIAIMHTPQWSGILARLLTMTIMRRRRILRSIRRWWMRPIMVQRNEAGVRLLNTLMEEESNFATLNLLRMTKQDFDLLLSWTEPIIRMQDTNMRLAITPKERLLITLRYLATGDSFASLHYLFQIPSTPEEWMQISDEFEEKWGFPHVIGAMDGRHIEIRKPRNSGSEYYNYKGFHSIVLLAIVDANYNFLYADVGCQGRISDGGVFKNCAIYPQFENNILNLPEPQILSTPYAKKMPYVLLGDKAFALSKYCLRPFSGTPPSCPIQRNFNVCHSRSRAIVENTFGIHNSRFRVLDKCIPLEPTHVKEIVLATVYLHNFIRASHSGDLYLAQGTDAQNNGGTINGSLRSESNSAPPITRLAGIRIRPSNELNDMRMQFANYLFNH